MEGGNAVLLHVWIAERHLLQEAIIMHECTQDFSTSILTDGLGDLYEVACSRVNTEHPNSDTRQPPPKYT
eukprot:5041733-Amphidinium_carterae.2